MTAVDQSRAPLAPGRSLSFRKKLGFGSGDFALNLYWQTTSLYLLYFYTDVAGLPPAIAGWIFGAALLWDAACDPLAGYIASRTRTRWGAYRPYLLLGCVPLGASFVLMFLPIGLEGRALLVFVLVTHVVFRTVYAVVSMPYNALMATMTSSSEERGGLAAFRMICATAAGLFVALATLPLVQLLGRGDAGKGFLFAMLFFALLSLPVFLFTFSNTEEQRVPDPHRISWREALRLVVRNRAFQLLCGLVVAHMAAATFLSKTLPYVLKYGYGRADLIGIALALIALQALVAIPFWAWVMRRRSKRFVALCGGGLGLCAYAAIGLTGMPPIAVLLALLALAGIAGSALTLAYWAMLPDTVEYGEWRTGVTGGEGVLAGTFSLAQKTALAISVGLVGQLLDSAGYTANTAQSSETSAELFAMLWRWPLIFLLVGVGFIYFYPLSRAAHARIVEALGKGSGPRDPASR
jgi:glycoside/pentoside/hexuronide:cation symporter, GPH family